MKIKGQNRKIQRLEQIKSTSAARWEKKSDDGKFTVDCRVGGVA
ncbi:unnamed protein product [marine sediment metagenome]|uniref:Uncharacterized protein n=1 Tax=marine sediment metagenome TaxID=412755 RepID=X1HBF4_9ZZZZ